MADGQDFFADGQSYDRSMGRISRVAGVKFLDWLSLPDGLRWLDVGCGTGSFTELILDRSPASKISAVDPSADQIAFAKSKPGAQRIDFRQGDAMALPFAENAFDVAVLALVIQYISDRDKAMAELVRVVRPGGTVAAYVWPGRMHGHPNQPLYEAVKDVGGSGGQRPGAQSRSIEALINVFERSGLSDVDSDIIEIRLEFDGFDDYWSRQTRDIIADLAAADVERVKALLRERLPTDSDGRVSHTARAYAVKGRVPSQATVRHV